MSVYELFTSSMNTGKPIGSRHLDEAGLKDQGRIQGLQQYTATYNAHFDTLNVEIHLYSSAPFMAQSYVIYKYTN